ncbi:hypothetical protein [Priestia megaterium]|uniref:hypothetical protein n=1 Tax=Priestia megaterium TaxID=1404 RepID=UPI00112BC636|nr:hypothetical protein [Priestia megaterium]TPF17967.1 hypothetical protein CBE78_01715 [Priestia megaterium]TPF22075.1 hypothetical protein CBE79_04220 [Priestia megaterium]
MKTVQNVTLPSIAQNITNTPTFKEASTKQVKEVNGSHYSIDTWVNDKSDRKYKYGLSVHDDKGNVLRTFEIHTFLNKNATRVNFELLRD